MIAKALSIWRRAFGRGISERTSSKPGRVKISGRFPKTQSLATDQGEPDLARPKRTEQGLPITPAQGETKAAYTLLLYHAALVQSVCSGLVAGQMGEGKLASGAKHVAVLMTLAYVVFLFI